MLCASCAIFCLKKRGSGRAQSAIILAAVEQPQAPGDGDVIPFPFGRT